MTDEFEVEFALEGIPQKAKISRIDDHYTIIILSPPYSQYQFEVDLIDGEWPKDNSQHAAYLSAVFDAIDRANDYPVNFHSDIPISDE